MPRRNGSAILQYLADIFSWLSLHFFRCRRKGNEIYHFSGNRPSDTRAKDLGMNPRLQRLEILRVCRSTYV